MGVFSHCPAAHFPTEGSPFRVDHHNTEMSHEASTHKKTSCRQHCNAHTHVQHEAQNKASSLIGGAKVEYQVFPCIGPSSNSS